MNIKIEQITKVRNFLLLTLLFFIGVCSAVSAAPQLSQKMIDIFENQSKRLIAGNDGVDELLSDLDKQAKEGDPIAQFFHATMSSPEHGFDAKAKKYLQSSASSGCAGAAGILSTIFFSEEKSTQALMWLEYAAKNGDAHSQYQLGQLYLKGSYDTTKNEIEGASWILIAKNQSYSNALNSLIQINLMSIADLISSEVVANRHSSLKSEVVKFPKHPCGQSLP